MRTELSSYCAQYAQQEFKITEGFMTGEQAEWSDAFLQKHPEIHKILEIGFNGGFSSGVFLNCREDITVTSVDLGAHDYILPTKAWIDKKFPNRHLLLVGDSTSVLPRIPQHIKEADCIFIDGGHLGDVPYKDIQNTLLHCRPDAYIIIDDYAQYAPDVVKAVNHFCKEHKLHAIQVAETKHRGWVIGKKVC